MTFRWDVPPTEAWDFDGWRKDFDDQLTDLMRVEAANATDFLHGNAPWKGRGREGLQAYAWEEPGAVGITATYGPDSIDPRNGFNFGFAHELWNYANAGIISIILNRREPSFLGEFARDMFGRLRARFGG